MGDSQVETEYEELKMKMFMSDREISTIDELRKKMEVFNQEKRVLLQQFSSHQKSELNKRKEPFNAEVSSWLIKEIDLIKVSNAEKKETLDSLNKTAGVPPQSSFISSKKSYSTLKNFTEKFNLGLTSDQVKTALTEGESYLPETLEEIKKKVKIVSEDLEKEEEITEQLLYRQSCSTKSLVIFKKRLEDLKTKKDDYLQGLGDLSSIKKTALIKFVQT